MNLPPHKHLEKDGFRQRGLGFSRIDAFSDVVFGFALTLLVVSLEIPKTYGELHDSLRGFVPFAVCFLFLMMLWHAHYKFFRRFGTHDHATIWINGFLLFMVLFFVYPLKFLFTFLFALLTGSKQEYFDSYAQVRELMMLYGVGFAAVYLMIGLLYWNALRQRECLQLTPMEVALTRSYVTDAVGVASIGLLSCLIAAVLPAQVSGMAGWVYGLISVFKTVHGRRTRKIIARRRALEELTSPPRSQPLVGS